MRPGGIAGAADIPYKLPLRYIFPTCHRQRRQMPISRNPTIPMLNEHTIAKGPHSTHAVCWCPSVLRVANSPGRYRIDRLAVTVGKGDVNAFVAEVGVPSVTGEWVCKTTIGYGAGITHAACAHQIIQDYVFK